MHAAVTLAFAMLVAGCARPTPAPPLTIVNEWRHAIETNQPRSAYALLTDIQRAQWSYPQFKARWDATAAERSVQAAQLATPLVAASARVANGGDLQTWLWDAGAWRVQAPFLRDAGATPRDVIASFDRAIQARDVQALTRLLPEARSEQVREQYQGLLWGLAHQDAHLVEFVNDDTRVMRWDAAGYRYILHVAREGETGAWRLIDLAIRPLTREGGSQDRPDQFP